MSRPVYHLILDHWQFTPCHLPPLLDHPDGLALLALLINAGAKAWPGRPGNPALYALKADAVRWACLAARPSCSWQDTHDDMALFVVQTGLRDLADQPLQLAFHFPVGDTLPDLPAWPSAHGRRGSRQIAQPHARAIAQQYLAERGALVAEVHP